MLMAEHVQRKEEVLRANVNQALMVQNAKVHKDGFKHGSASFLTSITSASG